MSDFQDDPEERRRAFAENAGAALGQRMGDMRRTYLIRGAVFLVLGLIALFWPTGSISVMLSIFGIFLILDAVLFFFAGRRAEAGAVGLIPSVATGVLGVLLLFFSTASIKFAFILLGLWAIVTGISYLMEWRQTPEVFPDRASARNSGIAALVVGIVLVLWPGTGPVALGWALAAVALIASAFMFYLAAGFKAINARL
ncbi:MAG: DUF308 domain-containing protein [Pseudomonadota bacterium]